MDSVDGGRTWYIDPIDGTSGFTKRTDHFAIHYGFAEEDRPNFGAVYKPTTGELYWGIPEVGAFRENWDGSVTELKQKDISDRYVLAMGNNFQERTKGKEIISQLKPTSNLITGSSGIRVTKLLENIADAYVSERVFRGGPWDICGPEAILMAFGGKTTYSDGTDVKYGCKESISKQLIIARNEEIYDLTMKKLNS